MLLCKAAFLDHRMKSLPYLSEPQRDEVKNAICDEAEAVLESEADLQDLTINDNVEKDEPPPRKETSLIQMSKNRQSYIISNAETQPLARRISPKMMKLLIMPRPEMKIC